MYNIYIYIHRNSITCLLDYMYIFTYKQIFHGVGLSLKKSVIEEPYVGPVVASIFFVSQDHHHQDHHHSRGSRDSRSVGSKSKAPWLGLTHAFIFLYIEYIFIMYIYIYIYLCIVFKINIYIYIHLLFFICVLPIKLAARFLQSGHAHQAQAEADADQRWTCARS